MGQYFGNLWIPFVSTFEPDDADRETKIIKHVDSSVAPYIAEFANPVAALNMAGTVIPVSTSDKSADDYIEDIQALTKRPVIDNYFVDFAGRSGFMSIGSVSAPKSANNPLSRDYTAQGNFLPMRLYQPTLKVNPRVMANDFGFVLGTDDVDCYVARPIGSTEVSGGDGSTISYTTEDGTIVLTKMTTSNTYKYDYPSTLVDAGEVKIFDTRGEALEADWFQVFNRDHEFTGDIVISNGLYRAVISTTTDDVVLKVYITDTWYDMITIDSGNIMYPRILKLDMETIHIKLNADFEIALTRGLPIYVNTGTATLNAGSTVTTGNTSTDNYLAHDGSNYYVCSNESFSISGTDLDTGKKWFYYAASDADIPAHMVMVERNLTRFLGDR
jgi:hypothetical protein